MAQYRPIVTYRRGTIYDTKVEYRSNSDSINIVTTRLSTTPVENNISDWVLVPRINKDEFLIDLIPPFILSIDDDTDIIIGLRSSFPEYKIYESLLKEVTKRIMTRIDAYVEKNILPDDNGLRDLSTLFTDFSSQKIHE